MSSPISPAILTHSATLYPTTGVVNSVRTYGAAVNLTSVRVRSVKQTAMASLGEMKNDKFLLTFDCVNSVPAGTTFKANDKIVYGSYTLAVRAAIPATGDSSAVHHWEVSLV